MLPKSACRSFEEAIVEVAKAEPSRSDVESVTSIDQAWQPAYIHALPYLPAAELQVVPTYEWMHHFDRSLLLTQLGGTSSSPSFYHVPEAERSLLPNRGYKDREAVHEHFDQTTQAPTALSSPR
ncbi:MAG: Uncharacterized protein AUREO_063160 [Aureobasidium pullulans]|nr:MAG: Uncharacterized protein AUREO_063160 [Aureobasidium pullulans]